MKIVLTLSTPLGDPGNPGVPPDLILRTAVPRVAHAHRSRTRGLGRSQQASCTDPSARNGPSSHPQQDE